MLKNLPGTPAGEQLGAGRVDPGRIAGEELAGLAVERPGAYLQALQQLRAIMENERPAQRRQQIRAVQRVLWSLLPDPGRIPLNRQSDWGDVE